jgi:hypothetical protein
VWSSPPIGYADGIVITNNATLTVNGVPLYMNPQKKIVVNAGCKLILNQSNLSCSVSTDFWGGIDAIGSGNRQLLTNPDPRIMNSNPAWEGVLDPSQTLIKVNGSDFTRADRAIYSTAGAVVRISNGSSFGNCKIGVHIENFRAVAHSGLNASYIMNTWFVWIGNVLDNHTNLNHVVLENIDVINIGGCKFYNDNTTKRDFFNYRGVGIYAQNSDMVVQQGGNSFCSDDEGCVNNCELSATAQGNEFIGLEIGIRAVAQATEKKTMVVRNSSFLDCHIDVFQQNGVGSVIRGNSMNASLNRLLNYLTLSVSPGTPYYASISMYDCDQFTIYDNDISFNGSEGGEMINVDNCGSAKSEIRKNRIKNGFANAEFYKPGNTSTDLYGIVLLNNCAGIHIFCNEFDNLGADIVIYDDHTVAGPGTYGTDGRGLFNTKVARPNSPQILPGKNIFSDASIKTRYHIADFSYTSQANPATDLQYIYDASSGSSSRERPSSIFVNPGLTPTFDVPRYTNQTNCDLKCSDFLYYLNNGKVNKISAFQIYPNPVTDHLYVNRGTETGIAEYVIYDAMGAAKKSGILSATNQGIDVSHLPAGLYFIRFDLGNATGTTKFVKQ